MTKNPVLYTHFNRQTTFELKRSEKIFLKNVEAAKAELVRAVAQAEEIRKEINFRTVPEAQQMMKDIKKLERMLKNNESGKTPLSVTKLKNVAKALDTTREAFRLLLLYGTYLRGDDQNVH